jgi:hypothetical protein
MKSLQKSKRNLVARTRTDAEPTNTASRKNIERTRASELEDWKDKSAHDRAAFSDVIDGYYYNTTRAWAWAKRNAKERTSIAQMVLSPPVSPTGSANRPLLLQPLALGSPLFFIFNEKIRKIILTTSHEPDGLIP